MRLNAHKLKDLERKARQHQQRAEEEQAAQAVKAVHFAEKYQHIQPKVTAYMKVSGWVHMNTGREVLGGCAQLCAYRIHTVCTLCTGLLHVVICVCTYILVHDV